MAELTVTTALFLMFAFGRGFFLNRFPIGDVQFFLFRFDTVFPFNLNQDMIEVDVAHAANDELFAFNTLVDSARRIFFADPKEGVHQFFFFTLLFRNEGYRMERVGETNGIIGYLEVRGGKGIAGPGMSSFGRTTISPAMATGTGIGSLPTMVKTLPIFSSSPWVTL